MRKPVRILWGALVLFLLVFLGAYIYKKQMVVTNLSSHETGKSLIGGPFKLIDQKGRIRKSSDFKNKYMLVYFGYSYCPDICPTGLQSITEAINALGKDAGAVQPVFITVDPGRDTSEQLLSYMENFHPKFVALTGDKAAIKDAMHEYKVYAAKSQEENKGEGDYLIDHSSIVYFMAPGGEHIAHFTHATPGEDMAARMKQIIQKP